MYAFDTRQIKVIDLESYHRGPYLNEAGRLPGSTRYMAPEEHTRGAMIDARTTVFNLGRMIEIFLTERFPGRGPGRTHRIRNVDIARPETPISPRTPAGMAKGNALIRRRSSFG